MTHRKEAFELFKLSLSMIYRLRRRLDYCNGWEIFLIMKETTGTSMYWLVFLSCICSHLCFVLWLSDTMFPFFFNKRPIQGDNAHGLNHCHDQTWNFACSSNFTKKKKIIDANFFLYWWLDQRDIYLTRPPSADRAWVKDWVSSYLRL